MEYIIVLDPDTKSHSVVESDNYFLEKFSSYESAKEEAELWKQAGDCKEYRIYGMCTDERNHII